MKKVFFPLPIISKSINRLAGTTYFTRLYIMEAYHRLWIAAGKGWKIVFCTLYKYYEHTVILFGLVNFPAAF